MDSFFDRVASGGTRVTISALATALSLFLYLWVLFFAGKIFGNQIFDESAGRVLVTWVSASFCLALSMFPPFFKKFNADPVVTSIISLMLAAPLWFYFCLAASCGLRGDCL